MKAVVAAFNQEKALVGAFSVITNLRMELFGALVSSGLGCVEVQLRSYLGRPGELEQVDHVLLEVLHVGHGLLGLGLLLGLLGLLWLLLILLLLKCQG